MNYLRKISILAFLCFVLPNLVHAGSISLESTGPIKDNKYTVYLKANDIGLNYINGKINIKNGTITKVRTFNGWINKTDKNENFYFYRNGIIYGDYIVASFEVAITNDSVYSLEDIHFENIICSQDIYGNYFDKKGNIVTEKDYKAECEKSDDASLQHLAPEVGTLSPNFSSQNDFYTLNIEEDKNTLSFTAIPTSEKAKIVSTTTCSLHSEITNCYIVVESEIGTRKTYTISVTKKSTSTIENKNITGFMVHNGKLTEDFLEDKYTYNLVPNKNADSIYFSMKVNNTFVTSTSCKANASTCELIVTVNKEKKKYVFTILNQNATPEKESTKTDANSNNINSNKNTNTTSNKTLESNSISSINSTDSSTNSEKEVEKESKEETIDPITYNKTKKENEETKVEEKTENQEKKETEANKKNWWMLLPIFIILLIGVKLVWKKR